MIHGVVLKGMVIGRLVPEVPPELGAKGLLPYSDHAYREASETSTSSVTTMVVHSSHGTMMPFPSAVGSVRSSRSADHCARVRITAARFKKKA